jgi:hypothetical protein
VTESKTVAETVADKYGTWDYDHALTVGSDVPRAVIYEAPLMDADDAEAHEPNMPDDLMEQARDLVTEARDTDVNEDDNIEDDNE